VDLQERRDRGRGSGRKERERERKREKAGRDFRWLEKSIGARVASLFWRRFYRDVITIFDTTASYE